MCWKERKIPAAVVGTLSVMTLVLAICMALLAVRFNNSGISTDLGSLADYANFTFITLVSLAGAALLWSLWGLCVCKFKNRCIAICFGCTLLPIALSIVIGGVILTTVSHTDEADLDAFCSGEFTGQ